jgi:hypothetical protein
MAPMSRIETGAFGPAGAQGSLLRRTFRGRNLRAYLFHWPTRIRIPHVGRTVRSDNSNGPGLPVISLVCTT